MTPCDFVSSLGCNPLTPSHFSDGYTPSLQFGIAECIMAIAIPAPRRLSSDKLNPTYCFFYSSPHVFDDGSEMMILMKGSPFWNSWWKIDYLQFMVFEQDVVDYPEHMRSIPAVWWCSLLKRCFTYVLYSCWCGDGPNRSPEPLGVFLIASFVACWWILSMHTIRHITRCVLSLDKPYSTSPRGGGVPAPVVCAGGFFCGLP